MTPPVNGPDDQLADLLRDTFTAHEHLADPERAVALARTPARRTHPVAVTLAAIGVAAAVALGTTYAATRGHTDAAPTQTPSATEPSTPATTEIDDAIKVKAQDIANEAEAEQLALALLDSIPELPEAHRVDSSPVPKLAEPPTSVMSDGQTRSATTWWTVPGTVDDAVSFYLAHVPTGMELEGTDAGTSTDQDGVVVQFIQYVATDAPPFGGPLVFVDVMSTGGGVAVRADSFVKWAPSRDPDSLVAAVSSVDVSLLRRESVISTIRVDGPGLAELVDDFNALEAPASFGHHCMDIPIDAPHYRLVFHTETGVVVANSSISWMCEPGFTVSRDGHDLKPPLAVTNQLNELLHGILPPG